MDKFHFSTAECFDNCPLRFRLSYKLDLTTIENTDPANPLKLGTALHRGIETDVETAIREYLNSYPIATTEHYNEVIKLEYWIAEAKKILPEGLHEVPFANDVYMGTADMLVPVDENTFDLYDFKYSNNVKHYLESRQLHVYKFMLERIKGYKIRNMYFVFVPKIQIRQKQTESVEQFRNRLKAELPKHEIQIEEVPYNPSKVLDFYETCMKIGLTEGDEFEKNESYLCNWCEFKDFCEKGTMYMILPKAERREVGAISRRKLWIYGSAFSGKTTFMDSAPSPLNLNTDGNIQFVTMPFVPIKDTYEGRQKVLAWDVFKNAIAELEKGGNDFKTLIVDLLEDTYECCRIYMYDKLGITHESDDSFRAWDKVRTEFLSTIRRLMNLNYENIVLISHEDTTKDIMKKSGDKITAIKPNIPDKVASKIAGMVDIVARVVVEDDDSRTLNFKSNEVIFGGGRLKNLKTTSIPLDWNELVKVYEEANFFAPDEENNQHEKRVKRDVEENIQEEVTESSEKQDEVPWHEEPAKDVQTPPTPTRKRRVRKERD